ADTHPAARLAGADAHGAGRLRPDARSGVRPADPARLAGPGGRRHRHGTGRAGPRPAAGGPRSRPGSAHPDRPRRAAGGHVSGADRAGGKEGAVTSSGSTAAQDLLAGLGDALGVPAGLRLLDQLRDGVDDLLVLHRLPVSDDERVGWDALLLEVVAPLRV